MLSLQQVLKTLNLFGLRLDKIEKKIKDMGDHFSGKGFGFEGSSPVVSNRKKEEIVFKLTGAVTRVPFNKPLKGLKYLKYDAVAGCEGNIKIYTLPVYHDGALRCYIQQEDSGLFVYTSDPQTLTGDCIVTIEYEDKSENNGNFNPNPNINP